MIKMKEQKETIMAIGVLPNPKIPVLFFDIDSNSSRVFNKLKEFSMRNCYPESSMNHRHYAIYITYNGFHYVMKTTSWEETKSLLLELREEFPESDYMSQDPIQFDNMLEDITKTMRIRISPKIVKQTLMINSLQPILVYSCSCYKDLRVGTKEVYEVK